MMTALEKAPTILTAAGARKLTASIRRKLEDADAELVRAYEGRVWEALDLPDWATWVAQSFPELESIKLSVPARQERAVVLRLVGASERDIAAATGVSPASIHADLAAARKRGLLDAEPTTTRGRDGRDRPSRAAAREQAQVERHGLTILMHEAWQRVAGCGDGGMTCLELERRARWRHGRASSLLHRLERAGLVERSGAFRDEYGVYVARPLS
jgi:hypothetical protein